jgi:hypothetical protein
MKLKLDAIQAKYMPLTMQGQPAKQPVLKIVAGDFEATTSRLHLDFAFPCGYLYLILMHSLKLLELNKKDLILFLLKRFSWM